MEKSELILPIDPLTRQVAAILRYGPEVRLEEMRLYGVLLALRSPRTEFRDTFRFARGPSAGITYSPTNGECSPMCGMAGPIAHHRTGVVAAVSKYGNAAYKRRSAQVQGNAEAGRSAYGAASRSITERMEYGRSRSWHAVT
jgi:hypothetical protein